MSLLLLVLIALASGALAGLITWRHVHLAATAAVLGALAYVVPGRAEPLGFDAAVERWTNRHTTGFTADVCEALTHLGDPTGVVALAAVVAVLETYRTRSRWVIPFLFVVVAGNGALTTGVKELVDRARPALNPVAENLGPSFPSGHSSWSAAFWAAAALLMCLGRPPRWRPLIVGVCGALAVAIAATRVLLGVHWVSDVLAGLALGWTWFAFCSLAFGRLLRDRTEDEPEVKDAPGEVQRSFREALR